jgi:hypothetical protein
VTTEIVLAVTPARTTSAFTSGLARVEVPTLIEVVWNPTGSVVAVVWAFTPDSASDVRAMA